MLGGSNGDLDYSSFDIEPAAHANLRAVTTGSVGISLKRRPSRHRPQYSTESLNPRQGLMIAATGQVIVLHLLSSL